ncbi:MAG: hypothetical protein M0P55_11920 [Clostridiales bacterium]|nr:hypothetical protein [Clostridiales bacterium]
MPDINALWWLTLILLAIVLVRLLLAERRTEKAIWDAFARQLPAEPPARPQSTEPVRPQRIDRFFTVAEAPRENGNDLPAALQYTLPRAEKEEAAVADCHHCA